ncbi:uncharacterized protein A1O9_02249 [Exophiala aquamarina CBS 119918]|uniref:Uncharacterized protein n=1 Tax=Exophiala aquamarina CBS 119918 TaxID=1182545 RepID=A0A072PMX7_9EURO|nr:uncharacterized protein A1O9_02249 [Exophiala aquamarina CBS 119918]KEF60688.1 hypothetical protein A1O9_02249 [Exophiala aquamarina CBS 119918]
MTIDAFVRFTTPSGNIHYGSVTLQQLTTPLQGQYVTVLSGTPLAGFQDSEEKQQVDKVRHGSLGRDTVVLGDVLSPIESTPLIICIGLNYKRHAEEGKNTIPDYPVVFTKPPDALAGPYDTIPVHPSAQSLLDYEGELTVIIGRDAKNVSATEALSYVLGYSSGNDVSARNFQIKSASGGQFCYAKSFDRFAPIGPVVVLAHKVPNPQDLQLWTKINGQLRQQTNTDDMIWTVAQIIEHLSRGTTLRRGTVIMTGTPSGVGCFMEPRGLIHNGDVIEVGIDGLGSLANRFNFEESRIPSGNL